MGFWGEAVRVQTVATDPLNNDVSTADTIQQMIAIARVSSRTPFVAEVVDRIIQSLGNRPTNTDLVRAIYRFVKATVTFCEDETILGSQMGYVDVNQELLITPMALLSMPHPMGDCDDFSTLVATLCVAVSIPVWFVTVAVDELQPFRFSHVYCKALVDGKYIMLDASHGGYPGWETNRPKFRRAEWFVN